MNKTELIKKYIDQVRHNIYNLYPADDFLSALQDDLEDYTTQFPECDFDDIIEQFGNPEMVARDFLNNADTDSPKAKARKKKLTRILFIVIIIVVICLIVYCCLIASQQQVWLEDTTTIIYSE